MSYDNFVINIIVFASLNLLMSGITWRMMMETGCITMVGELLHNGRNMCIDRLDFMCKVELLCRAGGDAIPDHSWNA